MKTPYSITTPRFLLLGDSHAGVIGKAAQAREVPFGGGPLGTGRDFAVDFFSITRNDVVFRDGEMERLYRQALDTFETPQLAKVGVPLVSTIGLSLHYLATAPNWTCYQTPEGEFDAGFLAGPLFESIVDTLSRSALAFYEQALAMKLKVFAVLPPQRVPELSDPRVFMAAQTLLIKRLQGLGVELIDVRAAANDEQGFQRSAFCEVDDPLHGNLAFGELIVEQLLEHGL
ncbi:hypothetical protein [Pseudomonas sp. NPDC087639]|uniref:hypothetical protein n=1 Tax=Pseudomonas sp. NPDC087639 TaxID=3364445 RepID=UPI0038156BBB